MDCSLPGFSLHGILQARIPEWVAISFSRGSSQPRDQTNTSCLEGEFFPRILSNTYSFFKANHSILGLFLLEHFLSKNPIKVYPLRLLRLNKLPNAALQTLENNAKLFVQPVRPVSWATFHLRDLGETENTHMQALRMIHWCSHIKASWVQQKLSKYLSNKQMNNSVHLKTSFLCWLFDQQV